MYTIISKHLDDVVTPPSSSIEYSLQFTSTGVCITCTFLNSSATDCVAVVHQRISQLNSSGLMNIESSRKLNRSGDTASGCIEGVNVEDYQVGVVGGRRLSLPLTETEGVVHVNDVYKIYNVHVHVYLHIIRLSHFTFCIMKILHVTLVIDHYTCTM